MKEMYIPCSTSQEKQEVIKHLVSLGYIDEDTDDHYLNLRTHEDDCIQSVVDNHFGKLEIVTPSQLLNKQETPTMNKLKEAVQNSGLNKSELSRRLGKRRNYIGEILRVGCSTKKQNELIEMINQVKAGERFKSDDEIIANLSEKLDEQQQENSKMRGQRLSDGITIGELQTKNSDLIRIANQKSEMVKLFTSENSNLKKEITTLTEELDLHTLSALELAGELEKAKHNVARLSNELSESGAFSAKLEGELTKAGEELLKQDRVIEYRGEVIEQRNSECIRLEDEITLLNKENSELNKQRKSYMAAFFMLLSLVVICLMWSAFK